MYKDYSELMFNSEFEMLHALLNRKVDTIANGIPILKIIIRQHFSDKADRFVLTGPPLSNHGLHVISSKSIVGSLALRDQFDVELQKLID